MMGLNPENTPNPTGGMARADLERAIGIYLEHAYGDAPLPEAVRRRLAWREGPGAVPLHDRMIFEASNSGPEGSPIYAIRLGNARYPHMKLQVQPWPSEAGFLLSVNTHDQVAPPDPSSPEAEAFRALQAENQQYKERIEAAWEGAGLPTFLAYLKQYIQSEEARAEAAEQPHPDS